MDVKYSIFMDDPSRRKLDELNKAEEIFLSNTEHQACKDYGETQAEYLKAVDFMDILTEKI
eukprot:12907187-Prorocentrum_lima.AAC.1